MRVHVIIHFDGSRWLPAQFHKSDGPPLDRVRTLLKGRWTKSSGHLERDGAAAFWNSGSGCRVLVMTESAAMQMASQ